MVRTIITLSEEDKSWLDNYSHLKNKSVAEVVRMAIRRMKEEEGRSSGNNIVLLTAGLWKSRQKQNSLRYVEELRNEWEKPA